MSVDRSKPRKKLNNKQGSPISGEPEFLIIGRIRKPHGLKGELAMEIYTDFPDRIRPGKNVYIGENKESHRIRTVRNVGTWLNVTIEGLDDFESVDKLRNVNVFVKTNNIEKLEEGQYYHHELLGLLVYTVENEFVGVLSEIIETGSVDVYVITRQENGENIEELIPAIEEVLIRVDLPTNQMVIKRQEWDASSLK